MLIVLLFAAANAAQCTSGPSLTHAVAAHVTPNVERTLGGGRLTTVQVTVAADGSVIEAKVYKASGIAAVDAAAIAAARASTYSPAMADCHPVAETVVIDEVVRPHFAAHYKDCMIPYEDATVLKAVSPQYPTSAARTRAAGQAAIQVTISPNGELLSAHTIRSTGNMALDEAALDAARQSIYAPKIVHCVPTTATYLFQVTFRANPGL